MPPAPMEAFVVSPSMKCLASRQADPALEVPFDSGTIYGCKLHSAGCYGRVLVATISFFQAREHSHSRIAMELSEAQFIDLAINHLIARSLSKSIGSSKLLSRTGTQPSTTLGLE